jgi:hypothetical protein
VSKQQAAAQDGGGGGGEEEETGKSPPLTDLKLKRATFMPARSSSSIVGTSRDAGPSVQTMRVAERAGGVLLITLSRPSVTMFAAEEGRRGR